MKRLFVVFIIVIVFPVVLSIPVLAEETGGVGYTGVDIVAPAGKFDEALSGEWELVDSPGSEKTVSKEPGDRIVVSHQGYYKWMRKGQVISKGKLVRVQPKTTVNKRDDKKYWGITVQNKYYYIFSDKGKVSMKDAQTHVYVANLKKIKK